MTLLGLLGRALGVALLFGVVLLPTADHHLAGRLPGAHGSTVHRYLTHHHSAADHPVDAAPLVLPLGAAALGVAIPSPFADGAPLLPPPVLLSRPEAAADLSPTAHLAGPPPIPPPILPA
jgi:hypothetical protein